jgi:tetratricopeptide (TPR) repeat protein
MNLVPVFVCLSALALLARPAIAASSTDYPDSARIAVVRAAQDALFNDRFQTADSLYRDYIRQWPDDPGGYLYRAGVLMADMSDCEENLYEDEFKSLLKKVDSTTGAVLDTCSPRTAAWMYLFRGHSIAYHSLWESRFGSRLSAVRLGLRSDNEYEDGLERDSTVYDLYFGLGSYHYWKSAKAGMLRWFGIFRNEKNKGIKELRLATDSSLLHRDLARSSLIWIWLDGGQYDSAIVVAQEFAARFPDGKTFLWPLAQAWYEKGDCEKARDIYRRIRDKLAGSPGNYFNLIECDFYITQCCR